MAKGYPDYFGQSIWPKYGTMIGDDNTFHPIGVAVTNIAARLGQGVLLYFEMYLNDNNYTETARFEIFVDGISLQYFKLSDIRTFGGGLFSNAPIIWRECNLLTGHHSFELKREIPYGLSFKIVATTFAGDDVLLTTFCKYRDII
jgi:hypothetical protein